ncbi:MAG: 23S rRNA (pseudouridine(1915)-N(3))-methyltransferase RlmH [Clostridia bacterium]|nr:23S rRNA (pseudouridine(1915)-N(3))-methyltransferase RlmH [Clostridia bacterium]
MLNIKIICLGKLKESYLRDACAEYIKRLGAFCKLTVTELAPAKLPDNPNETQIACALKEEAKKIEACTGKGESVIALCIEGKELTSEKLSEEIDNFALSGESSLVFVIGSSYGLDPEIKTSAKLRLSMSRMTFPHQLARVMLLEQIYRAFMISSSGKYHK